MVNTASALAIGRFEATTVADAEAQARDGCAYYSINWLPSSNDERVAEIQFADGLWMLVGDADLYPGSSVGSLPG